MAPIKPFTILEAHPMALTKSQSIEKIRTSTDASKNKSSKTVETQLEIMKETLESGEDVLMSGFGKFCAKNKRDRRGRKAAKAKTVKKAPAKKKTPVKKKVAATKTKTIKAKKPVARKKVTKKKE